MTLRSALSTRGALAAAGFIALSLFSGATCRPRPSPVRWSGAGTLAEARKHHTATLLPGGRVLVAGGVGTSAYLASAELHDPATGSWSTAAPMAAARAHHTATALRDGRVLVTGGLGLPAGGWLRSAEIYDPATGAWSSAGQLATGRAYHTASPLGNGSVVIAGGTGPNLLSSVEVYTPGPGLGSWRSAASMQTPRTRHAAATLPDGISVLVAGGLSAPSTATASAEQYDSVRDGWTSAGSLRSARMDLTLTLMALQGKVLAVGGQDFARPFSSEADVWTWGAYGTPGSWTAVPDVGSSHSLHTATLLADARHVLVAGGLPVVGGVDSSLFDAPSGSWSYQGGMASRRLGHTATRLGNGKVLVVGGYDNTVAGDLPLASAELFTP